MICKIKEREIMARRNGCKEVVLPSVAIVAVEFSSAALNILFKAAALKGMSYFVFTAYCYILGAIVFFLSAFLFNRKSMITPLMFPLFSRICLLAVFGFSVQLFAYKGLEFGSPTLASAIGNLVPAFAFILAVFFRLLPPCLWFFVVSMMEKVAFRNSTTRAKIIGTTTSICGALVIIFYKGPKVIPSPPWTSSSSTLLQSPLVLSSQSNWTIGGLLVSVAHFLFSLGYIIQSQAMKIYPEELTVNFFYFLFGTIISLPVCILAEPNLSSWGLGSSIAVVAVLYSGLFGFSIFALVQVWGIHLKGPVFVASFKPTSVVIAVAMSAIFLGEAVYLGGVIGTLILCTGLYCVLWGKAKEETQMVDNDSGLRTSGPLSNGSKTVPFLQSHKVEEM